MINIAKPLQRQSWAAKIANNHQFFKDTGDFLIANSRFGDTGSVGRTSRLKALYEAYNSKYPSSWFKHVTDPFSGNKAGNTMTWPAKIRPMNILRPNIEFLRGEYPKRPFNYQIVVKGEDGYNAFLEGKKQTAYKSVSQIFINTLNELGVAAAEQGEPPIDTGVESKETPLPDELVSKFESTFKNILAAQGQTDLDLIFEDQKVKEKLMDMMKDWLIAGEAWSYKDVRHNQTIYERVSPLEMDSDDSSIKYKRDGDWAIRRMLMNPSDIVDRFYESLKEKDIDKLEDRSFYASPSHFHNHLQGNMNDMGKIPVYHYTFRSFEKIGMLTYFNPITGEIEEDMVNEDYKIDKSLGETIEWIWRTRWLEGWRIGEQELGLHVEMGPVRYSPSMMNDLGKTYGPYNGRSFSNTHAENISVLKMGLPFQIMYIISNFALERTLAKSRGKIMLIDQNVIPKGAGWNEERFFQFSEAQGWAVINRNQVGVDKSFNQYQMIDLGLFDHIDNLISIMDFCKRQFDEQLGISRQAKAQVTSSDSVGGTQQAIFQSSVITDMIFTEFEQFALTDVEGLLDCSQISNVNGKRAAYVGSEGRTELLNIIPEEYCYSQMGIMAVDSTKENDALNRLKQYGQAFAQNGSSPSTIIAIETATNIAKLKELLMSVERKQMEIEQEAAESEQQSRLNEIELQQQFAEFNTLLDTQRMHEEYNRKEDLVLIQGDINMALEASAQDGSGEDPGLAGVEAMMKYSTESAKIKAENDRKDRELAEKVKAQRAKQKDDSKLAQHKMKMAEKDMQLKREIKNKEVQIKRMAAKKKPAASK